MKRNAKTRQSVLLLLCLFVTLVFVPAETKAAETEDREVFALLKGKTAGVMTGTPQDQMVEDNIEDPKLLYYNSFTDMALALQEGKIDYYVNSSISYRIMQESYPQFGYLDAVLRSFDIGAIFPMTEAGDALRQEFNAYIAEITEDGSLDEYKDYWLNPNDWETVDIPAEGEKGTLKMAATSAVKPFAFKIGDAFAGFDIAVAAGFCRENGYGLEIDDVDFAGCLSGITSGKYDLAAGQISWTEERAESVYFSDFYCQQDIVPIVMAADYKEALTGNSDERSGDGTETSVVTSVAKSFRRTFLDQDRWQSILSGLGVTLIITLFGFLLANLLGGLVCAMAMAKSRILRGIADLYSRIMQGTPIVVILMILYYVIFGHTKISGILVAIIGFGITSGAYLAQLFEGAIRGVDRGQNEAALAMGFTPAQAFNGIVLPQAVRRMLPGYFSQLISLMKGTAVVGYIAVVDLTKAGDIIRSSTFEAFFPLIAVAVIYFVVAALLLSLLKVIQKKLAPKRTGGNDHD